MFKENNVTLTVGKVLKQRMAVISASALDDGIWSQVPYYYTVSANGKDHKVGSINQFFHEQSDATMMIDAKGKADLLFDVLGTNAPPFVLNDEKYKEFLGGNQTNEMQITQFTKKFKLFGGSTKAMEKQMRDGSSGMNTTALVVKREVAMETLTLNKVTLTLRVHLLAKEQGRGHFLTTAKHKISFNVGRKGDPMDFASKALGTTVGMFVEISYDPANMACAIIKDQLTAADVL